MTTRESHTVRSADGTRIAFDRVGDGPPLILVEAALHYGDAVEHFHRSIGVPLEFIGSMRSTPGWGRMESIAHTLVYDCMISDATTPSVLSSVEVPTLILDSEGSTDNPHRLGRDGRRPAASRQSPAPRR